jgi:EAL domain-containing protein (putative c-di-GMP-specific phosphodiesterase class I)
MEVIAEGVETLEQAEELRSMNCDYGQGFYFSKALNANSAVRFLSSDPLNKTSPPSTTINTAFVHDSVNASSQTKVLVR